jgi:3-oxoadipate enol-lactonase
MFTRLHRVRFWLCGLPLLSIVLPVVVAGQAGTLPANGENLYYEASGAGPPLILIHGWSLNLGMWDGQVSALSERFRVIRYDRRGFGKSTGEEDLSWDGADLSALLDHLGIDQTHVLGMSQGGRVALQFAHAYPERVLSLVLHGTSPLPAMGLPWTGPDRPHFDVWTSLAREEGLDVFRRAWAAHPLMEIPDGRIEAITHLAELLADYRGGRLLRPQQPSGPIPALTIEDLLRLNMPTLVLMGDSEAPFLQIVSRALAYYIPDARLAVVPGGGHMVNLIEPERYNATVLAFLSTLGGR